MTETMTLLPSRRVRRPGLARRRNTTLVKRHSRKGTDGVRSHLRRATHIDVAKGITPAHPMWMQMDMWAIGNHYPPPDRRMIPISIGSIEYFLKHQDDPDVLDRFVKMPAEWRQDVTIREVIETFHLDRLMGYNEDTGKWFIPEDPKW